MSYGYKVEMLADLRLASDIIDRAKNELEKVPMTSEPIHGAYCGEYSLEKIKRNCIVARELLNNVRQGCEYK